MKKNKQILIYGILALITIVIVGYILYRPVAIEKKNYELNKISTLFQDKRIQYDSNTKMISFSPNETEFNNAQDHFTTKIMINSQNKGVGYGIARGMQYTDKKLGFDTLTFDFNDGESYVLEFAEDDVYVSESDGLNIEYVSITHRKKDQSNKEKNVSELMEKFNNASAVKLTFSDAGDKETFDLSENEILNAKETWELYNLILKYPQCLSGFKVAENNQ